MAGFARSLRATWPRALLRFLASLAAVSLLWGVSGPVYAAGLGVIGRALIPVREGAPGTRYGVENGRLVAYRPIWLPKQKRRPGPSHAHPASGVLSDQAADLLLALLLRRDDSASVTFRVARYEILTGFSSADMIPQA